MMAVIDDEGKPRINNSRMAVNKTMKGHFRTMEVAVHVTRALFGLSPKGLIVGRV